MSDDEPAPPRLTPGGLALVLVRGVPVVALIAVCLVLLLALRLIERPIWGLRRPVTPYITQFVCRSALVLLGIRYQVHGTPMRNGGAAVANHSSWLDVFALNAAQRIYFVAKAEVAGWPGIGWLARATGTLFIRRQRQEAAQHVAQIRSRLAAGHTLLFFPEGTSSDGLQVLPFKPTLFAAFLDPALRDVMQVQPVTLRYGAPRGADPRHYGWWGTMALGPHLLGTLMTSPQGRIDVIYHPPLRVADYPDRKALAAAAEAQVAGGLTPLASPH